MKKNPLDEDAEMAPRQVVRIAEPGKHGSVPFNVSALDHALSATKRCFFCRRLFTGAPFNPIALLPILAPPAPRPAGLDEYDDDDEDDDDAVTMSVDTTDTLDDKLAALNPQTRRVLESSTSFCAVECWVLYHTLKYGEGSWVHKKVTAALPNTRLEVVAPELREIYRLRQCESQAVAAPMLVYSASTGTFSSVTTQPLFSSAAAAAAGDEMTV